MWHPTGAPRLRLALGQWAGTGGGEDDGPVDLAVVAPSGVEVSRAWLRRSISLAGERLAADGVLWIIVSRRWRGTAERALRRCDLVLLDAVLTIPAWPHSEHLVPLEPAALRDAGPRHLGLPRAAAWIAGGLVSANGVRRLVRRVAPGCALVAAREPRPRVLRWLGDLDGRGIATATVSAGPRRGARVAVAMRFGARKHAPDLVVKVALDETGMKRVQAERAALERLGAAAASAGAEVPVPRPSTPPWLLATSALAGRPAAAVLASASRRLEPIAAAVADWLLEWNSATASEMPATEALLDELLVGPADRLTAAGVAAEHYAAAMTMLAGRLQGRGLLVVAAHNDLTMANVLDGGQSLGILDWESATAVGLPLVDLWYALADGVVHASSVTHAGAVEALVAGRPPAPAELARTPAKHAAALGLTVDQAILAFHACWLGHADDELRRGLADGPFMAVVRGVGTRRLVWL
jgi:hypothetical protein